MTGPPMLSSTWLLCLGHPDGHQAGFVWSFDFWDKRLCICTVVTSTGNPGFQKTAILPKMQPLDSWICLTSTPHWGIPARGGSPSSLFGFLWPMDFALSVAPSLPLLSFPVWRSVSVGVGSLLAGCCFAS